MLLTSTIFRIWKKSNDILLIIKHVSGVSVFSTFIDIRDNRYD